MKDIEEIIKYLKEKIKDKKKTKNFWDIFLYSKIIRLQYLFKDQLIKVNNNKSSKFKEDIEAIVALLHQDLYEQKNIKAKFLIYSELSILYANPNIDEHDLSLGYAKKAYKEAKKVKGKDSQGRLVMIALYSQGLALHHLHKENEAIKVFASKELDFLDLKNNSYRNNKIPSDVARKLYLQIYAQTQRADALIHSQRCFEALWILSDIGNKNESRDLFEPHWLINKLTTEFKEYHHLLTLVYIKLAEAALDMGLYIRAKPILHIAFSKATKVENKNDYRVFEPSAVTEIYYHMARLKLEDAKDKLEKLEIEENEWLKNKFVELLISMDTHSKQKNDENKLKYYGASSLLIESLEFQKLPKYKFIITKKRKAQIIQKLADVGLELFEQETKKIFGTDIKDNIKKYKNILNGKLNNLL